MTDSVFDILTTSLGKLDALGTPGQIRDFFVQEHIAGISSAYQCPVACYLSRELGAAPNWRIACVTRGFASVPRAGIRVITPPVVKLFIERFDRNAYPDLKL
jgi:hypothetical protein